MKKKMLFSALAWLAVLIFLFRPETGPIVRLSQSGQTSVVTVRYFCHSGMEKVILRAAATRAPNSVSRYVLRIFGRFFLPRYAEFSLKGAAPVPGYSAVFGLKRIPFRERLIKLILEKNGYREENGTFRAENRPEIRLFHGAVLVNSSDITEDASGSGEPGLKISADNGKGFLSEQIFAASERNRFDIFPSISNVAKLSIEIAPYKGRDTLKLLYEPAPALNMDPETVKNDMKFAASLAGSFLGTFGVTLGFAHDLENGVMYEIAY